MLVPRDDPEALARGIAKLLDRPAERSDFGARGRARIEEFYSWRRVALATADVYAEVVNEWRGRVSVEGTMCDVCPLDTATGEDGPRPGAERPVPVVRETAAGPALGQGARGTHP